MRLCGTTTAECKSGYALDVEGEIRSLEILRSLASEERITTTVDIRSVLPRKREALFAHGSQIGGESWFSKIPEDIAAATFGRESFIRASDTTGAPLPEDDLFAGLRP